VRFWARVQTLGFKPSGQDEAPIAMGTEKGYQDFLVDSGTTLTFLPPPAAAAVRTQLGGVAQPNGDYAVNCSYLDNPPPDGGLVFHFAAGTITVPYHDLVVDLRGYSVSAEQPGCFLGIGEAAGVIGKDSLPVLGSKSTARA
jgi:hypothetical protein